MDAPERNFEFVGIFIPRGNKKKGDMGFRIANCLLNEKRLREDWATTEELDEMRIRILNYAEWFKMPPSLHIQPVSQQASYPVSQPASQTVSLFSPEDRCTSKWVGVCACVGQCWESEEDGSVWSRHRVKARFIFGCRFSKEWHCQT